jgi:hypothetical protein
MSYDKDHSGKSDNPFERMRRRISEICQGDEDDLMEQKTRLHQLGEMLNEVVTAVEGQAESIAELRDEVEDVQSATAAIQGEISTLRVGWAQVDTQSKDFQEALARKDLHENLAASFKVTPSAGLLPQGTIPSISKTPKTDFLKAKVKAKAKDETGRSTPPTTQQRR